MFIYKITNLINNKIYIGKTIRNIQERWNEHVSCALNNSDNLYLHNAIQKYGANNFKIEVIDSCNSEEELNQLEEYYIKLYNTQDKNIGYNLTNGGDGNLKYDYKKIREMWDEGLSCKQIVEVLHCDKGVVTNALKNHSTYNYHLSLQRSNTMKKIVYQFDYNYNLISQYDSIVEAANKNQCSTTIIQKVIKNKTYSAIGYFWNFEPTIPTNLILKQKVKKRQVIQLDSQNNIIQIFSSLADAARSLVPNGSTSKINSISSCISQVCKNKRVTAYGYKWQYFEEE